MDNIIFANNNLITLEKKRKRKRNWKNDFQKVDHLTGPHINHESLMHKPVIRVATNTPE